MVEQGVATNRLPAAGRKRRDNSTINLELGVRPQAACGSTLTLGNNIMRIIHMIVILALSLVSKASSETAEAEYIKALSDARKKYISRVVATLPKFDRVEVLKTDGQAKLFPPNDGSETISVGECVSKIVSKKDLNEASSKSLVKALIKQLSSEPEIPHTSFQPPHVGVRVYKGKKVIFETVVSIGGGYLLHYPDHHVVAPSGEVLQRLIKAQQVGAPNPLPSTSKDSK